MAKNKVIYGNETIIDLTDSTVTPETMLQGAVAYNRSGERIVGVVPPMMVDDQMSDTSQNAVENRVIKSYVDAADRALQFQIDGLGEPYRLYDFNQTVSGTLFPVTSNTGITGTETGRIDIDIGESMAADWAIASMCKWEIFNGSTRVDAFPMYEFSMQQQRILRVGFRTSGTENKTFTKIQGALLLKHR